ncbi:cyclohexanone monooxygenase [Paraburkholderia sp. HC6.4b]|uniref:flavin-containing monooxygenase n=1 Tax=unclassified Paraburkholderia TaxID=2615204 RepID=UPI0016076AD2|nr:MULTISPECIES: NAD(P)/FAD-dependent oxidoreductase [unclassified Paraburkholderia]MBB5406331.1 cyclohexanone monooxygenase [Paraburkholderia sp. HC6.4b]MBB5448729.1 cyclohexanone monooxygenase [Paraburkholderia sp. Kb1A]
MSQEVKIVDAVVIGAGFAGLYAIKRLRDAGFSVQAFEAGDGIGGTWYWNHYPGARVDLECWDYSYSFSSELQDEWEWSQRYPSAQELMAYLEHVADRFKLRQQIQFNTRVEAAEFIEADNLWLVRTSDGKTRKARFLVPATGGLSVPKPPEIPGIETFRGEAYHTGRWPRQEPTYEGKRIGVIGTGSSGVQVVHSLAGKCKHLTVFQRTAVFVVPAKNHPLTLEMRQRARATYAERRSLSRITRFGIPAPMANESALDATPEERRAKFENAWINSQLLGFRQCYGDILANDESNEMVAEFIRSKIREIVKDPETSRKLLPYGFPFGTKRPCLSDTYYSVFNRDDVSLVDLKSTPIVRIVPKGVETSEGLIELDMLIYATGYDAFTGALSHIDVRGVGGRKLSDKWAAGAKTYLGLVAEGFPNLFTVTGPGSPGPLANMAMSIEQHVDWIADCMTYLRANRITRIDADKGAEENWMQHVQDVVSRTLYEKANSWYRGANVPGKPQLFLPYLGGHGNYRKKCEEVAAAGYLGFVLTRETTATGMADKAASRIAAAGLAGGAV